MEKQKYLIVKFPTGEKFKVPAKVIAENRTQYYADRDGFKKGSAEWKGEFEASMDDFEIYDWASNNMNWEDLAPHAELMPEQSKPDYEEMWGEAEKETHTF